MADRVQRRTLSHTGNELGDKLTLDYNQTDPQRKSTIVGFECPRKFESIRFRGRRHHTKLVLRTMEEHESDGSTEVELDARIQAIAGEEDIDDQPYPVCVAVNVSGDDPEEIPVVDANYATNTVTLYEAPDEGDDLKLFPIISQGAIQYQGVNQFNQVEGPVDRWETPIYRWHDFDQDKRGTEINLQGEISWTRYERLEMVLDSPETVVWQDDDYPGSFVSTIEQQVDVEL
jgi:hypothetical protein